VTQNKQFTNSDRDFSTPQELLDSLFGRLDEKARKSKDWPSSGRGLTNELKRIAPSLRARGIAVERLPNRKSNRGVPWRIGPERKVAESSVISVTTTDLQLDLGDLTAGPALSRLVTSVTPSSTKTERSSVGNDSGDLGDSVNRQFSPEEVESSLDSEPVNVGISLNGTEEWVNRHEH
jgi:hypothetical protein